MSVRRMLVGAGLAGALVAPAAACDLEELNAHLAAVCLAAVEETEQVALARSGEASAAEQAAIARALRRVRELCAGADPIAEAREAARLARLVGRIEGRAGITIPIWPKEEAKR
ncbi:MAG: hypothetical protein NZ523_04915 [Elioraea sp.]|nr:hypothetical protein [Elioraea sp.]